MATASEWTVKSTHSVLARSVESSPQDDRQYRLLKLKNELVALLVSDPSTDKAAASLTVQHGHLSDPDDLPGAAHGVEHLLFLGTERFPDESDYKKYLAAHSGSSNASTSASQTTFHFDVAPDALDGAVERHAQFFTKPLFDASCVEREINAVNSEMNRNLQLDNRRLYQLRKATASRAPGAVFWKFGTGSKRTLWDLPTARGEDVRARLMAWYHEHYSANLMRLAIVGQASLDELEDMAVRHYSHIPNADMSAPWFDAPQLGAGELQTVTYFRNIRDLSTLRLEFPQRDSRAEYRTKPASFLSHYVGHEGDGSLLSALKKRGWATALSSGVERSAKGIEWYSVTVTLTPLGLKNHLQVLSTIFQYIQLLRESPLEEWAFREVEKIGRTAWRFKEKGQPRSLVNGLVDRLTEPYEPSEVLRAGWYADEWRPEDVASYLAKLVPTNARAFVGSQKPLDGIEWSSFEGYYGTEYSTRPLHVSADEKCEGLRLPSPNPFIADQFDIKGRGRGDAKRPSLLDRTSVCELWHKLDSRWLVPRTQIYMHLKSPRVYASPEDYVRARLWYGSLEESMNEKSYDASLAGLDWSFRLSWKGAIVRVGGYDQKAATLMQTVLDRVQVPQVDKSDFALVKDRLRRGFSNRPHENPIVLAEDDLDLVLMETNWTHAECLAALQKTEMQDVEDFGAAHLRQVQIDVLVHGNSTQLEARALRDQVIKSLSPQPLAPGSLDFNRGLLLPPSSLHVYQTRHPSAENVNSAIVVYLQVCETDNHVLATKVSLLAQMTRQLFFATLRTKEQLGYIVSSSVYEAGGVKGIMLRIQSERTCDYLDARVEAFLAGTLAPHLDAMSDDDFATQKQSLIDLRLEQPKNLAQEATRYWAQIGERLDFAWRDRDVAILRQVTKQDMLSFFDAYIRPGAPSRRRFAVWYASPRLQPSALAPLLDELSNQPALHHSLAELARVKPTAREVRELVATGASAERQQKLVAELDRPLPVPPTYTSVEDLRAFKKTLERAKPITPVADFSSDLRAHAQL